MYIIEFILEISQISDWARVVDLRHDDDEYQEYISARELVEMVNKYDFY